MNDNLWKCQKLLVQNLSHSNEKYNKIKIVKQSKNNTNKENRCSEWLPLTVGNIDLFYMTFHYNSNIGVRIT